MAKSRGLWNLWVPPDMADKIEVFLAGEGVEKSEVEVLCGPRLSNFEYGVLAGVLGRCVWASEAVNCSAPDTGNMELLAR